MGTKKGRRGCVWWIGLSFVAVVGLGLILILAFQFGGTNIDPAKGTIAPAFEKGRFRHDLFDQVLTKFVTKDGQVDYQGLRQARGNLDRYYAAVTFHSPDNSEAMFEDIAARKAYWLNAYNAAVLVTVLDNWPIGSVADVRAPWYLFFLPEKSGFFLMQRPSFGGKRFHLYELEHDIIRKRFDDPRVHFALNCASAGCPKLQRTAFRGDLLDSQLARATREFLAEDRNVAVDHERKVVLLSALFEWYSDDFLSWVRRRHPDATPGILAYVAHHTEGALHSDIARAREAGYRVEYTIYDWRLNGR